MTDKTQITQLEYEVFTYLNDLRETGETNMFGSAPYIAETFNMDKRESSEYLMKWMDVFNPDGYDYFEIYK